MCAKPAPSSRNSERRCSCHHPLSGIPKSSRRRPCRQRPDYRVPPGSGRVSRSLRWAGQRGPVRCIRRPCRPARRRWPRHHPSCRSRHIPPEAERRGTYRHGLQSLHCSSFSHGRFGHVSSSADDRHNGEGQSHTGAVRHPDPVVVGLPQTAGELSLACDRCRAPETGSIPPQHCFAQSRIRTN